MNSLTELENTYRGNCFVLTSDALSMASKEALVKLKDAMSDSGKSVEDLFKEIDTDGDGTINGPELYKGIKVIAGEALTPSQISMIITALDTNGDNRIDVMELRNALS
ncbi:MAG: EF-hand domain-containing protein [Candidatus Poseidoniaceae archaeon]